MRQRQLRGRSYRGNGIRGAWSWAACPARRELAPSARAGLSPGKWTSGPFGLTLALCRRRDHLALPFLDPEGQRARKGAVRDLHPPDLALCLWRFTDTLAALGLRFDSLYAWGFSMVEALACLGWTIRLYHSVADKEPQRRSTHQAARWLGSIARLPRIDVLITTYNEEEADPDAHDRRRARYRLPRSARLGARRRPAGLARSTVQGEGRRII